jgi:hypothetical protein
MELIRQTNAIVPLPEPCIDHTHPEYDTLIEQCYGYSSHPLIFMLNNVDIHKISDEGPILALRDREISRSLCLNDDSERFVSILVLRAALVVPSSGRLQDLADTLGSKTRSRGCASGVSQGAFRL